MAQTVFQGAVFGGHANFCRTGFGAGSRFDGAVFEGSATFTDAVFAGRSSFTGAVFVSVTFDGARFGNTTWFDGVLFVASASFVRAVFGEHAGFEGASFNSAHFSYSEFGHNPTFDDAVFSRLVQFDYASFGDHAYFRGTAFEGPAIFDMAEFGDGATFEAHDPRVFNEAATERAKSLPEGHRELYLNRARTADPSGFQRITYCRARFGSEDSGRDSGERVFRSIVLWLPRLFHSPPHRMGSQDPGASFSGRTLHGFSDFSRAQFDQPPDFADVRQVDHLDLAGAVFSFRASGWPRWRYWTTQTATATRLRRLQRLASEIHAVDAERDFAILERIAERGIAWSAWWAKVVRPWDFHRMMRATPVAGVRRRGRRSGLDWLRGSATSAWFLISGVGRPAVLTMLTCCYRILSDFGRSVVLPTVWFIVSLFAFGFWYGTYVTGGMSWKKASALATFTMANAIPFAGASRQAFVDSAAVLFTSVPEGVHAIALAQGIVSAVLLFLIILALRNHFRIR
jgi:uncharacterized protein YjbI with pentapeptide repeats